MKIEVIDGGTGLCLVLKLLLTSQVTNIWESYQNRILNLTWNDNAKATNLLERQKLGLSLTKVWSQTKILQHYFVSISVFL